MTFPRFFFHTACNIPQYWYEICSNIDERAEMSNAAQQSFGCPPLTMQMFIFFLLCLLHCSSADSIFSLFPVCAWSLFSLCLFFDIWELLQQVKGFYKPFCLKYELFSNFLNTKLRRTPRCCGSSTWHPYPVIYQRALSGHKLAKQNTGPLQPLYWSLDFYP